jgi:hypothetical protein
MTTIRRLVPQNASEILVPGLIGHNRALRSGKRHAGTRAAASVAGIVVGQS